MNAAYAVVSVLLAAMLSFSATTEFIRYKQVLMFMAKVGVPESWLYPLASLKVAGALGLLIGIAVPAIGIAAAIGVTLFFVGAVIAHVRVRSITFLFPFAYLVLAVAALALGLAK